MTCKWKKLGLLYRPSVNHQHPKLVSHAANPLPVYLKGDIYRIYYNGRDIFNRSSIGAVDVDIVRRQIIKNFSNPFFEHGTNNSFYANGVSIGNCYEVNGVTYMLFMGWQKPEDGHWRGDIGRLIVDENLNLKVDSEEPLLGSNAIDPISLSYPWVMRTEYDNYNMWYPSVVSWDAGNGEMLAPISFACSTDGHNWIRKGQTLPYKLGIAQAFSRPNVIGNVKNGFEMWFSYRGSKARKYRIGYAQSKDGKIWKLALNMAGIDVSTEGWDSEMIEYSYVFDHKGHRYMLYNGNGYGRTGFGIAVLE